MPDRQKHARSYGSRGGPRRPDRDDDDTVTIYGIHAVEAALLNPRRVFRSLALTDNAEHRLREALGPRGIVHDEVLPRDLDRELGADTVHQGALAVADALPNPDPGELAKACVAGAGPVIVLDQVTDPHNVGAILRSAAVLGAAGLIMTRRNSPPLGGALAKAASGALEVVPVSLVTNLSRSITDLKERGVTCLGLAGDGDTSIDDETLAEPTALILGAEGRGLRKLTRDTCDRLTRIAAANEFASLNVSNAAAVSLYAAAVARRRRG
jgi:23S rRNA (guanosine2251-2'-O)-methyltransferase